MVIVDSTVLIDVLGKKRNPHTEWLQKNSYKEAIGITDLILCETLQGVRNMAEFERVRKMLNNLMCFETGGRSLAVSSARNYSTLRYRGITVRKTVDCIIATFCIQNHHMLLHHDRDFDYFERELGLNVINTNS